MKLAGFIYLYDISSVLGPNIDIFRNFCGNEALKNVVLGTTKWDRESLEIGQWREQELKDEYWKEMVQQGSVVMRVHADSSSAWRIVYRILENDAVDFAHFQEAFRKTISDMEARTLGRLQKQLSGKERLEKRMHKLNIL